MNTCIFCGILNGKAEAAFVCREALVSAFMDIRPINFGHVIVVPNTHVEKLSDIDEATGAQIFLAGRRLAAAIRASDIRCEGINLFLADGRAAGQEIFHVHLHVIPRFQDDGFRLKFNPGKPSRSDLHRAAGTIWAHL